VLLRIDADDRRQKANQKLATKIEGLSDAFRKKPLREDLQKQGPTRLVAYLNNIGAGPGTRAQIEANLNAAVAAMEPMGVTAGASVKPMAFDQYRRLATLENVAPAVRLNLLLGGLNATAANPSLTPDQLSAITEGFKQDAARLPGGIQSSAAGLLQGFAKLSVPESASGPPDPWKRTADQGDRHVVYTLTAASGEAAQTLEFIKLDLPPSKQPTYLCTTELSLGTFLAAIPASDWARGGAPLLVEFQAGRDPRSGPRVWDWAGRDDPSSSPITTSEYWLRARNDDVYDYFRKDPDHLFNHRSLDPKLGDNPLNRSKLPMQYLPAPTAMYAAWLLGCRLPTSQEWKVAGTTIVANGKFNLRDETWRKQQAYVASNRGLPEWPDAGAFWPKANQGSRKIGANAVVFPKLDDGVLWFRDVDASDGQLFHNLVGNVWEYVWDDPTSIEAAADKSLRGWKALLESKPGQLAVIGGSALSAPELDYQKPWPVDVSGSGVPSLTDASSGYADVGLRLAFTVHPQTPAARLGWLLSSQPYVGATDASTTQPGP
jgi:hypothetical protein